MPLARYALVCAAMWTVPRALPAQHPAAAGVVLHAVSAAPYAPAPNSDSSHRTAARVATTVVGAAVGGYAGVAAVEVYRATHGIASYRGKRGADYVGAAIGATVFGVGTWLLSGKWL